jgi:hypothetical protein
MPDTPPNIFFHSLPDPVPRSADWESAEDARINKQLAEARVTSRQAALVGGYLLTHPGARSARVIVRGVWGRVSRAQAEAIIEGFISVGKMQIRAGAMYMN